MSCSKRVKLSEYAEINMGQSPDSKYYNDQGQGLPFLQGNRTFGNKYPEIDTYSTQITKFANKGDVLLSVRAPVGDCNVAEVDVCIGRGISSLNSIDKDNEFLYYLIKKMSKQIKNLENGSVFGSINKSTISELEVNLPEEKERDRVGHILSSFDELICVNSKINDYLAYHFVY